MAKKYLVRHAAVVGRTRADGSFHDPVYLTFYSIVEADSVEDVNNRVTNYSDPGFTCKVESIIEVEKGTAKGLLDKLSWKDVLKE